MDRRRRILAAAGLALVVVGSGAVTATAATAEPAADPGHEGPSVLALPLPAGALGGDLIGQHGGPLYVGASQYPDGTQHPTIWRRTGFDRFTPIDLGLIPGMNDGWASGANPRGEVALNEFNDDGTNDTAFVWSHGQFHRLRDLSGGYFVDTYGIQPDGTVFGDVPTPDNIFPVVWTNWGAPPRVLALPSGYVGGYVLGANPDGQLVGDVVNADGSILQPATWLPDGSVQTLPPTPPVDGFGQAWGVSNSGMVVGEEIWRHGKPQHATFWASGRPGVNLGSLPGDAVSRLFGVSPNGQAAGVSWNPTTHTLPRVLYWPGSGPLKTLRPFGKPSNGSAAHVVDNAGEVQGTTVVAYGTDHQRDIPTLWTDAPAQAFRPAAPTTVASVRAWDGTGVAAGFVPDAAFFRLPHRLQRS